MFAASVEPRTAIAANPATASNPFVEDLLRPVRFCGALSNFNISIYLYSFLLRVQSRPENELIAYTNMLNLGGSPSRVKKIGE
jgi:hypothetical protein